MRETHRLAFREHCALQATTLDRVVTVGHGSGGRKHVDVEADARRVEIILSSLGLGGAEARPVALVV